jgi:para-nitrobenzyl esterase
MKAILIGFLFLIQFATAATTVTTSYGDIEGQSNGYVSSFLGIPFAKAPIGNLRWAAPVDPDPFATTFQAKSWGDQCAQTLSFGDNKIKGSEDCLTLNIWSPNTYTNTKLPVMVWVHGGAQAWGSSSKEKNGVYVFEGDSLATSQNVVVVSVNYRLGFFGWLGHPKLRGASANANYGLLDLVQALKWVKDNIEAFGGDASNVTVFGESAGAANTLALLASPNAKGLFHRAIVQSGYEINTPINAVEALGMKISSHLGCDKAKDEITCMRSKPWQAVLATLAKFQLNDPLLRAVGPVVDGSVLPDGFLATFASGKFNKVPLMIGSNADEMTTLLGLFTQRAIATEAEYKLFLNETFGPKLDKILFMQYDPANYNNNYRYTAQMLMGDFFFHCPTNGFVNSWIKNQLDVYQYVYDHTRQNPAMAPLKAGHAMEIPFIFSKFIAQPTNFEIQLSNTFQNLWGSFAKDEELKAGSAYWNRAFYNNDYLNFGSSLEMKKDFKAAECMFWGSLPL